MAGGESTPCRRRERFRRAWQAKLRINFSRCFGQKRPQQYRQHAACFGKIVKHIVEPFGLRGIFGQVKRLGLFDEKISAIHERPDRQ